MFRIAKYSHVQKNNWDAFVDRAKNSSMLFFRDYMDYHSDRFEDFSLMIYRKEMLYALLPANRVGDALYSHQGLTYGGILLNQKATTTEVLEMFNLINYFLRENGIEKVVYKPTPHIYHSLPSEEDLYAMFKLGARQIGCNISSTIYQANKVKFIESRKSGIRKATAAGVSIVRNTDFEALWKILDENLTAKYGTKPVHSLEEIKLLHSRFPERIQLFLAVKDGVVLGGTVIYIISPKVVHTQYISASLAGKECGALDLLFDELINRHFVNVPVLDFGQSTEQMGNYLNESLIFQKEGFGGRGVIYPIYEYRL